LQLNLFESYEEKIESIKYQKTIDEVKNKYGKNSLLKASSLLDSSTIKERNEKIGGHHE
jgi:DNA polymerase V